MKPLISDLKRRGKAAFTLIEILVATVVMVVLVGLVTQITSDVLDAWNRSSGKLSANAQARIAMDLLTQDLESAIFRNNGMRWLEAEQENLGDPFRDDDDSFKTTRLKLFSPAMDRPTGLGDICGIAYLLSYSDPIDGATTGDNKTFILYRHIIDAETTFTNLLGSGNQEDFTNTEWGDVQTIGGGANYVASNIVDFRIDFYTEGSASDPAGTSLKVTGDVDFGGTDSTVGPGAVIPEEPEFARPLAYADITLKIISDEALKIIQNDAVAQMGYASEKEYVDANAEVFIRRVNFLARPF